VTVLDRMREHAEWSRKLEERCRPLLPAMTDASFRRIVGTLVDVEAHERRNTRPVFGPFTPRAYELPDGRTMMVLTKDEIAPVRAAVIELMNERYGVKPELPAPTSEEYSRAGALFGDELQRASGLAKTGPVCSFTGEPAVTRADLEGAHELMMEEGDDER
jgi:hypothetical protein